MSYLLRESTAADYQLYKSSFLTSAYRFYSSEVPYDIDNYIKSVLITSYPDVYRFILYKERPIGFFHLNKINAKTVDVSIGAFPNSPVGSGVYLAIFCIIKAFSLDNVNKITASISVKNTNSLNIVQKLGAVETNNTPSKTKRTNFSLSKEQFPNKFSRRIMQRIGID